ncbi:MAG: hypothetical protein L3K52_15790 [Candidatus Thiothrix sulfatifontis]|nr:MAG: hypothetical protein L3K52_15790 [Candidatus Thiothrix sulfatifontis]
MKIKTALNWLTLLISVTAATNAIANTTTYTITKNTGELVTPYSNDFGSSAPSVPSKYGDITPGPWGGYVFKDTFTLRSPKDCHTITSVKLSFKLKCDRGGNDCSAKPSGEGINFLSESQPNNYFDSFFYYPLINGSLLNSTFSPTYAFNSASPNQSSNNPVNYLAEINNKRRVSFQISDDTSVHHAELTYTCENPPKKGTTWLKHGSDSITGTVHVGCGPRVNSPKDKIKPPKDPYDYACNPKIGDQLCTTALPILCKHEIYQPKPNSLNIVNPQNEWAPQVVGTTKSIAPTTDNGITTLADANAFCAKEFGERWIVADFFDGTGNAGWNFHSYGNTGTPPRFWINVPGYQNCWDQ